MEVSGARLPGIEQVIDRYAQRWAGLGRFAKRKSRPPRPRLTTCCPACILGSVAGLLFDLRQVLRGLLRSPGFFILAVLGLALGLACSTAMFSVVDTVLLRRLPYPTPERQVLLFATDESGQRIPMGPAEIFAIRERAQSIESVGAFAPSSATFATASGPRPVRTAAVTAGIFRTLGLVLTMGRAFDPAEDLSGQPRVAVVSDAFWRRNLGSDPAVLGRTLQVGHDQATVVGVLAPGTGLPYRSLSPVEVLLSLAAPPEVVAMGNARTGLYGCARLKPGATLAAVAAELDGIVRAVSGGYGLALDPLRSFMVGDAAPGLEAAFAGVVVLLAIGCANVTLLLLMRGTAHRRDLAIRAALGGGQRRIAAQQILEGTVVALVAGALGLLLAIAAVDVVRGLGPLNGVPRLHELRVDLRMSAFALLASLLSGALAGSASAWHALRSDLLPLLQDGGAASTPRSRLRDALVVAQLALSLILAIGAGLLVRSLERFSSVPLGFEPKGLSAALVYPREGDGAAATAQILEQARSLPGVARAALVGDLPLDLGGRIESQTFTIVGRTPSPFSPDVGAMNWISPEYLETAGIRLRRGRALIRADEQGAPVALVNETFVRRFLPGREPVGTQFAVSDWEGATFTIAGVIGDVRQWGPAYPPLPEAYLPERQFARNQAARKEGAMLLIKSERPLGPLEAELHAAAARLETEISLGPLRSLDDYLDGHLRQRRLQLDLAAAFAAAALGLSALGVYASMAFSVVQRRRELAIRAALGARREQLARLVVSRGARLIAAGLALGLAGALALSRFLAALLYGVGVRDPLAYTAGAALLGAVAVAATLLPARAAAAADPMNALRSD